MVCAAKLAESYMQKLSTLQFFLQFLYWSGLSHSTGDDGEVGKWLKIALARVKFAAQSFGNYVRTLTPGGQISAVGVLILNLDQMGIYHQRNSTVITVFSLIKI